MEGILNTTAFNETLLLPADYIDARLVVQASPAVSPGAYPYWFPLSTEIGEIVQNSVLGNLRD